MTSPRKLGILASHPIQYQAPLFRELAKHTELHVFFAHRQTPQGQAEAGFNVRFEWDVDLLSGYRHEFLQNRSSTPGTSRFFGCDTPTVAAAIEQRNFDAFLVMGWNLKTYWQATLACRRLGVPVLVRGDSHLETRRGPVKNLLKRLIYPALLRRFDAGLYVGQKNRAYLLHFGMPPSRLFFSPHCIDNHRFAQAAAQCDRERLRTDMGIGRDDRVVLFVGKQIEVKRPLDVVHSLKVLRDRGLPARGLFVGDGPLGPQLRAQAQASGVPIEFVGFWNQRRLPQAYAMADVLVLPSSTQETWGLVVNEAMACGLRAVVSASVGCAPDLVKAGTTGEVFAEGNTVDLADALQRILTTTASSDKLAAVIANYSPADAARGILAAMNAVTASPVNHG